MTRRPATRADYTIDEFGELAGHTHAMYCLWMMKQGRVHSARALATLRNAILNLLRSLGWNNISDALRHYAAKVKYALGLIGYQQARL